jgi:hypothetical protein
MAFCYLIEKIQKLFLKYIFSTSVLKPGPAGRPETRPTRDWNQAGLIEK